MSAPQKPESQSHSWNELAEAQEGKRVKEFIRSGSGIIENVAKNPNIYSENAMYGEMSHAATTQAKLEAQGGIHKAVAVDMRSQRSRQPRKKVRLPNRWLSLSAVARMARRSQKPSRTASDMSQVRETGGKDAFIEAASVEGAKRGVTSKVQNIDV